MIEIFAIINITPDSFYKNSRVMEEKELIQRVRDAINNGADVIDIGGFSTRPGYIEVSTQEEFKRLDWAFGIIKNEFKEEKIKLSVDTFRADIIQKLYDKYGGGFVVNDIGGGTKQMLKTVGEKKLEYVLMSSCGTLNETYSFFEQKTKEAIKYGIEKIMLDPGFGFGKTTEQNFEILMGMEKFLDFGHRLFVGVSRKSMIYKTLGITAEDSLNGTTTLHTMALERGASVLRVHDPLQAKECAILFEKCIRKNK